MRKPGREALRGTEGREAAENILLTFVLTSSTLAAALSPATPPRDSVDLRETAEGGDFFFCDHIFWLLSVGLVALSMLAEDWARRLYSRRRSVIVSMWSKEVGPRVFCSCCRGGMTKCTMT